MPNEIQTTERVENELQSSSLDALVGRFFAWMQRTFRPHKTHKWAYACGRMPGIHSGKPRELCFRRCCTICGRREEIMRYTHIYQASDGTDWMAGPEWVEETFITVHRGTADRWTAKENKSPENYEP